MDPLVEEYKKSDKGVNLKSLAVAERKAEDFTDYLYIFLAGMMMLTIFLKYGIWKYDDDVYFTKKNKFIVSSNIHWYRVFTTIISYFESYEILQEKPFHRQSNLCFFIFVYEFLSSA